MTLALLFSLFFSNPTSAMNIEEYLQAYKSKNALLRAQEISTEALQGKVDAAEIDLTPVFTLGYSKGSDKSLPRQLGTQSLSEQYSASLGKRFFTGTSLQVSAQSYSFENTGAAIPAFQAYSTGLLGVSLRQSLWKDFFGTGTRTKIDRQRSSAQLEMTASDLQARVLLIEAESTFWDYVASQEDLKLKKANLDRAQKVEKWTARRFSNGISERADDLNAKALVSLRQMELIAAENENKNAEVRFRESLELQASEKTPQVFTNWQEVRPYMSELKNKKNIIKIESYLSMLEAKTKALIADETVDHLRPDLEVFGTYNYTGYNPYHNREQAWKDAGSPTYPQSVVGVNFTWQIDTSAKSGLRYSAVKEAEAAKLRAAKNYSTGLISWEEYLRIYEVTAQQVKILEQVADLQKKRSNAENDRFSKGRTVTSQVVLAETDAAEAETRLLRAKVGLRKYEASSLLYMSSQPEIGQ